MTRPQASPEREGRRILVLGTVQGVGFRPFVFRLANELGLKGRVRNDPTGVTIEAFGPKDTLDALLERLRSDAPSAARILSLESSAIPYEPVREFEIEESGRAASPRVVIPPDLATCEKCLLEVWDPRDRRYLYPFTNCTDCGPRFTIANGIPYDRPKTTMQGFRMCPQCAREYADPNDRRFHAQPNACPVCGPKVSLLLRDGSPVPCRDPIAEAAFALCHGAILAVKGIGGFHLACDATSDERVSRLRERKRRFEKPLAVMVEDLEAARALAVLSPEEEALLSSVERPIVLCPRRPSAPLAAGIAPASPIVGLLIAYSPLHHLLLRLAGRPLVMTSGNLSEEPIAFLEADALQTLREIADLFLVHDRPIASRCDDSVARIVANEPLLLRRARGFVPRPVRLSRPVKRPVLAVGAQKKNTFCLARGDEATLGPHVGDLDGLETFAAFETAIERLEAFLELRPEVLACDLHPLYLSTRYAKERARDLGLPLVEVQHHHAHAAAAMAERGLAGPTLALAWDGTGLGSDGTAWGGELLLCETARFTRLATFRPIPLAGGDLAVREPWRLALAALLDAFDGDPPLDSLALFREVPTHHLAVARRMLEAGLNSPLSHGVGRAFDAAGALALLRPTSHFEGQVALALDAAVDDGEAGAYPFEILPREGTGPEQLDLRPLWRALVSDLQVNTPQGEIAARFHRALSQGGAELLRRAARDVGAMPAVLTGGCFQNSRLAEGILSALHGTMEVHLHRTVPPGDGGLALGQAVVADAVANA